MRLLTQGAWFRQADYLYFNTVTCAGHASVSTGANPTDVAPTLDFLSGVTLARAHGRVLAEALSRPRPQLASRSSH
jgi:hypothetical protein